MGFSSLPKVFTEWQQCNTYFCIHAFQGVRDYSQVICTIASCCMEYTQNKLKAGMVNRVSLQNAVILENVNYPRDCHGFKQGAKKIECEQHLLHEVEVRKEMHIWGGYQDTKSINYHNSSSRGNRIFLEFRLRNTRNWTWLRENNRTGYDRHASGTVMVNLYCRLQETKIFANPLVAERLNTYGMACFPSFVGVLIIF